MSVCIVYVHSKTKQKKMAECDISNSDLATAFTSSSLDGENISNTNDGNKKRKTHRLKQRFQVVKKLGQGTYGKVQLAINNETGQEVSKNQAKKKLIFCFVYHY